VNHPVSYELHDGVATVTLDDGKANALSPSLQRNVNAALDVAERDASRAVVISGNDKLFCGGFDLSVFAAGDRVAILDMLTGGFNLSVRLLTFPKPIVVAVTGPAIAMGAFLLLSGDHRVGSVRARCQANEVAIGMTLPVAAIEIMRTRLSPAAFQRGIAMAAPFTGHDAIAAGWLDEIVQPEDVLPRAQEVAAGATTLDARAHLASKLKARDNAVNAIRDGVDKLASELDEIVAP
jgi:enoyl-CoA hydratase